MRAPSEPVKGGSADVEEFAHNVARMVEEGGKALAAYLKPREEGRVDDQYAEVTDVVKTLGQVAEYWLRDPQRALELQSSLGKAYLDLWASAVKRMAGETGRRRSPRPTRSDKRFADPEWSSNQFFDFLKQAYLLTRAMGRTGWCTTPRGSTRTPGRRPSSTSGRSPTRSRRRTSC